MELDPDRLRQIRTTPLPALLTQAKTRADLRQIQVAKRYKPGWVFYTAKERGIAR